MLYIQNLHLSGIIFQIAMSDNRSIGATKMGLAINMVLAMAKCGAGVVGHSYALIADGLESTSDIISSLFVLGGLHIAAAPADDDHPYGHGKAESIASVTVSLMLLGMAVFTAYAAVQEAFTPHKSPASFTLVVLVGVIVIKEILFRRVATVGKEIGSHLVTTDAWHHRSDAISSAAAFIGIAIALAGGRGWESADDWASLVAAVVIAINAVLLFLPALHDLMDRSPGEEIREQFRTAALSVQEVKAVEKLRVLRRGAGFFVDIHIQMDRDISLDDAHRISGRVKHMFRTQVVGFHDGSIHMEPFEG